MIHADHALARRLEGLICAEYQRIGEIGNRAFLGRGVQTISAAGGVALWLGEGSPVNQAVGVGMTGPVDERDVERLESFYREHGAVAVAGVCPLAHSSLFEILGRRGWRASAFEHVLVLDIGEHAREAGPRATSLEGPRRSRGLRRSGSDAASGPVIEICTCTGAQRQIWAHAAALGFTDDRPPGIGEEEFGAIMAAREEAVLVLAWADEKPVGTGCIVIQDGVGWLSGDSTMPAYRRRGVQQSLQRFRLQLAREAGCDLTVTEAVPGGTSQRNMERLGFRIVYTHVEFVKEL